MATRQYIGARYVPIIAGAWDATVEYEPLTVVLATSGNSYTSKTYVPAGTDVTDTDYWALTGNYNAQVQAYRNEVLAFEQNVGDLSDLETSAQTSIVDAINELVQGGTFVTPQLYGAVGDGVTDDYAAFQAALDTGLNVYVPSSKGEQYFISTTLHVTTDKQVIFGINQDRVGEEVSPNTLTRSAIIFEHNLSYGFNIDANGVIISNLNFTNDNRGGTHYVTAFTAAASDNVNTDLTIRNCHFFVLDVVVENLGRGLLFENNLVIACNTVIDTSFPTVSDTGFSSQAYGNRALTIRNNRFHAIATLAAKIDGEYINSCEITGNVMDVGRGFLEVDGTVSSMTISNNVIHYCRNNNFLYFKDTVDGLIISNNQFKGTTDSDININSYCFITFDCDIDNAVIIGNTFDCCIRSAITIEASHTANNMSITGNVFTNLGTDGNGIRAALILSTSATIQNSVITSNVSYGNTATLFVNALTAYTADSLWIYANSCPGQTVANRITAGTSSMIQS